MEINFFWEDSGCAGIISIICDCGYKHEDETVSNGATWMCPKCNKIVKFKWVGMAWKIQQKRLSKQPKVPSVEGVDEK